ncbi:TonB-dependent receptor [Terrimonas sp. NA20]|uniref:TonB-dependent receptor n=1 Tax=Terrimonas ginsenosidimutans TaxID=2908004 RepID=A0ABS9KX83_9BACT|nr:outer membrane beta-barrel protein [Terrimonas ginsenosidimutans]MCG2616931.1 TonB-dependent receptor [Terrimonas ginsenosidimutans]
MRLTLTTLACLFFLAPLFAQDSLSVKGTVRDTEKPLASVTVSLLKASDSSLVKLALTNQQGVYEFHGIKPGAYRIMTTFVGLATQYSEAVELTANREFSAITMQPQAQSLAGVTVQAKRPLVEARLDKMIVNVDASPSNAANNVLEVLEKSPGISVDRDGNISLKGKQGVIVLMDGKQTYLSGQDLANLLKSMSASQLDQIEIMTQPSAKYDAAGNSGIINLKTKKNKTMGFNGSVSTSFVQGYYPKSPNSFSFNYRKGKLNFFSNGGYTYWQSNSDQTLTRNFHNNGPTTVFDQVGFQKNTSHNFNLRLGMDYAMDAKTTLGFTINGISNSNDGINFSKGDFFTKNTGIVDSTIDAVNDQDNKFRNFSANINFRKQLNANGRELSADIDYIRYSSEIDQYTDNKVLYPARPLKQYLLRAILPTDIDIYTAKIDYAHPFGKNAKFETGAKTSLIKTDNNAPYETYDESMGKWVDDVRKDHFAYDEQISAVYVNFSKQVNKWGFQTGLRGEHTHSKGKQILLNKSISRDYFQLFPTAYISYAMNDKNQFGLNYGRRIERPDYQDMNPFQQFLDLYTYNQGNPYLTPQFTNSVELSHIFAGKLSTTLNYTHTTDIINDILKQDDVTKVTFQTKENVATSRNIGLSVSYNAPLKKWWTISLYGNGYNNLYKGLVNNVMLKTDVYTYMFNMNNQFRFAKTWGAEVSGFYQSRSLMTSMFIIDPIYVLSFGASKQILKNKGSLRLSIIDPFRLQKANVWIRHDNIDMLVTNRWDNRRVGLTFTYRFAKGQAVQQRRQTGGAADEQKRIGGGGN